MSLVAISTTTHQSSLVALATAVHEQCGWVVNSLQVAALLESMGINDVTAQQQYGYSDVFVLAEKIMAHLPRTVTPAEVHPPTPCSPLKHGAIGLKITAVAHSPSCPCCSSPCLCACFRGMGNGKTNKLC
ncbi:MAG: hypothetical protein IPL28_05930 [Chloroflexi bacterium]|nr:hypothetical protein [Chloroflexota bacterium]